MKKTAVKVFTLFGFSVQCICFGGCSEAKVTNKVVDESGTPLENAETWVSWQVRKTSNPWDGAKDLNKTAKTNRDGEYTFTGFSNPKIWIGANSPGYYETHRYYTFTEADEKLERPWHPTVTLVLRKIVNPIPMYAKRFRELITTEREIGYDLFKGDFVQPHGSGEIVDCIFKSNLETTGIQRNIDYKKVISFTITFPGGFNGIMPILEKDLFPESVFIWPREALDGDYAIKTASYTETLSYKKRNTWSEQLEYKIETERTPEAEYFFFRIRSEKNPDGTFKSAHYGKLIYPKISIRSDQESNTIRCHIENFAHYTNPTRNDRNMEYDAEHNYNLSYPLEKSWKGDGYWTIRGYKKGEIGVMAP